MTRVVAARAATLGILAVTAPAWASSVCLHALTDIELLHRVRQDAYFTHNAPLSKRLRLEYDGCGYRVHVGEHSPTSRAGDLLLVDRDGHVTLVIHQR